MPVVIGVLAEQCLDPDATLDDIKLGPEAFGVRPVNRAVNKVATRDIGAIENVQDCLRPWHRFHLRPARMGKAGFGQSLVG